MATDVSQPQMAKPKRQKIKAFNVLTAKSQAHPWENRTDLSDVYEPPVTGRESWWRCGIRTTPVPGSYETINFLQDLAKKKNSYRFKSDGRKLPSDYAGKGDLLLPGGYQHFDFIEDVSKKPATYRFKAQSRDAFDVLNFGKKDKDITVSPNAYEMEKYLSLTADKTPVKNFMFRSQSKRFPTLSFKPKEGPPPGAYSVKPHTPAPPSITSSFRSKTPRFSTSHTEIRKKVPGPGSYTKAFQHPIPESISKMGRRYGLFFTSEFQPN